MAIVLPGQGNWPCCTDACIAPGAANTNPNPCRWCNEMASATRCPSGYTRVFDLPNPWSPIPSKVGSPAPAPAPGLAGWQIALIIILLLIFIGFGIYFSIKGN
jgi:hypothetical protein